MARSSTRLTRRCLTNRATTASCAGWARADGTSDLSLANAVIEFRKLIASFHFPLLKIGDCLLRCWIRSGLPTSTLEECCPDLEVLLELLAQLPCRRTVRLGLGAQDGPLPFFPLVVFGKMGIQDSVGCRRIRFQQAVRLV